MQEYIRPNIILPVSLHDTRVSSIKVEDNEVKFIFNEGIFKIEDNKAKQTGKAFICFPKVDFDFCSVYCTDRESYRKEWDIHDFSLKLKNESIIIDIIDETYGYNKAKFGCDMIVNDEWFECDIEIYHLGQMKYVWE